MQVKLLKRKPSGTFRRLLAAAIGLLLLPALQAAHARSSLEEVTANMAPITTSAFSVAPPRGEHWVYFQRPAPAYVTFRKQDPLMQRLPGGEHLAFVIEVRAEHFPERDLMTEEGLEEALKSTLYGQAVDGRRIGMFRAQSFAWQNADCLSYIVTRSDPVVLDGALIVLQFLTEGFFCRHPADRQRVVSGSFQERRLAGTPSWLDDVLRDEAQQTLQSVRFLPAKIDALD
jgi:hypothetical protein